MIRRAGDGVSFEVRDHRHDEAAVREVWDERAYPVDRSHLPAGATVVDVGANIGAFSCYAALLARSAVVHAYEPDPDNTALLRRNVARNGVGGQVHVHQEAVWGTAGRVRFVSDRSDGHVSPVGRLEVPAVTLDDVLEGNGLAACHVLKVDAEGAEYEIFGMASAGALRRVGFLAMEVHPAPRASFDGLLARLSDHFALTVRGDCHEGALAWGLQRAPTPVPLG